MNRRKARNHFINVSPFMKRLRPIIRHRLCNMSHFHLINNTETIIYLTEKIKLGK